MSNSNNVRSSGIGLSGAVFLVFLVLKLTGHIDWSWLWVTAPLWLPIGVVLGFICFGVMAAGAIAAISAIVGVVSKKRRVRRTLRSSK